MTLHSHALIYAPRFVDAKGNPTCAGCWFSGVCTVQLLGPIISPTKRPWWKFWQKQVTVSANFHSLKPSDTCPLWSRAVDQELRSLRQRVQLDRDNARLQAGKKKAEDRANALANKIHNQKLGGEPMLIDSLKTRNAALQKERDKLLVKYKEVAKPESPAAHIIPPWDIDPKPGSPP